MSIKTTTMKKVMTETVLSAATLAFALIMPQVFHYFGLGPVFLPMYIPFVVLAFFAGSRIGGLVPAVIVPVASMVLFGMPALPVALLVTLELSFVFLAIRQVRAWNWNVLLALPVVLLAGRTVSLAGNLVLTHGSFAKAWAFTASAWPGLVALTVIGILASLVRTAKTDNEK